MPEKITDTKKKPTKRALQAAETKKKLLKAAFTLFAERGYDNVTVEDITKYAGVSKGTFYSHFIAKEAVLTEHFKQIEDLYVEAYRNMPKELSTGEKVIRISDAVCEFCEKECGLAFMRVIYANHLLHNEHEMNVLNHPERKSIPILKEIFEEGKRRGEIPEIVDNDIFAREVAHMAHGIIYDWCMDGGSFNLREENRRIFDQLAKMASAYPK